MPTLPEIECLWIGPRLSFVEQVVLRSYLDRGHRVRLYCYAPISGVPSGVEIADAHAVLPPPPGDHYGQKARHRLAVHSDVFRLMLMRGTGAIWSDLDAYCLRPLDFDTPHLFGWGARAKVCTGVLRLPPESEALAAFRAFVTMANPIQPWRGARLQREKRAAIAAGEGWDIQDLPWGCSGPTGFTHFLKASGEVDHALPQPVFYPLFAGTLNQLWKDDPDLEVIEPETCHSVHLFGVTKRVLAAEFGGFPPRGSYLDRICRRHGIDPRGAPV